jgi:hypothetical protein
MAESNEKNTVAERASGLSNEVLERVEAGQRAAIGTLRKVVDRLDDAMPDLVDDPSVRKKVVEAIGDYYEQLAMNTNEYLRSVVHGATGMVSKRPDTKDLYDFLRSFVRRPSETASKRADTKRSE